MRKTNRRERRSITKDLLLRLLKRLNTNTLDDVNIHVAFCLTFANFFRVNEFIYIKVDAQTNDFDEWHVTRIHVTMNDDYFTLIISFFKIDSFKRKIAILIAIIDDVACSLKFLRHLYASFSIKNNTFLFQIFNDFSRQHVIATFRQMLFNIDIKNRFSSHFFKRDVVTWAKIRNLFKDEIRVLSRWKFDNYLLYIDRDSKRTLIYSRKFQATK